MIETEVGAIERWKTWIHLPLWSEYSIILLWSMRFKSCLSRLQTNSFPKTHSNHLDLCKKDKTIQIRVIFSSDHKSGSDPRSANLRIVWSLSSLPAPTDCSFGRLLIDEDRCQSWPSIQSNDNFLFKPQILNKF